MTLVKVAFLVAIVASVAVCSVIWYFANYESVTVTSEIVSMASYESYEIIGHGTDGDSLYGWVWKYTIILKDGSSHSISSGDYSKLSVGDLFTYTTYLPKVR